MYNVIIIDDEISMLKIFPSIIDWESYGFRISEVFSDGYVAYEYLSEHCVDVIFTDISMPRFNGLELAKLCNEHYPDILIVFFSAIRDFEYAKNALYYNVVDYLLKPISFSALNDTLERLLKNLNPPVSCEANDIIPKTTDERINTVIQYLEGHYAEPIGLEDISKIIHMNPSYFSGFYKKITGEKYTTTLKKIRITHAKRLIEDNEVKTSYLHEMVGYSSYSYFLKAFSDICGMTPTEYKEHLQKKDE